MAESLRRSGPLGIDRPGQRAGPGPASTRRQGSTSRRRLVAEEVAGQAKVLVLADGGDVAEEPVSTLREGPARRRLEPDDVW
jgi:hypothetical protein